MLVFGNGFAVQCASELLELLVVTDNLQAVAGENDAVAARNVQALIAAQDAAHVHAETVAELKAASSELGADLMEVMTALSFQDLTGQRIKRIVNALQQIERVVFDLYMTTGLSMKAMEEHPEKDAEEILQTSRERASKLKGPQSDTSQADVDDLLSQLGL